jgi:hypothetical protein
VVDPQFHDASPDAPGVPYVSLLDPANTRNDANERAVILQTTQPCPELVRLMDYRH